MGTMTTRVVKGALLLTLAGLVSKVLSAAYRIPLQNLTGDFGFYIYQQVYPIIGAAMILALYGFPVAVSKLAAERSKHNHPIAYREFHMPILIILLIINGFLFMLMFFSAPSIAAWIGDVQLGRAFRLASFLFLLIPIISVMRGVFQGKENMKQPAFSQVLEQLIRVSIIILTAVYIYVEKGDIYRIGEAGVFATMAGMAVATIFLSIAAMKAPRQNSQSIEKRKVPWRHYVYICVTLGLVASLNHMILILVQLADVFTLVPNLMEYGLAPVAAMEAKGVFDRVQPLLQFGVVFGSSFALSLVPAVVKENENKKSGPLHRSVEEAVSFSFYIAAGAAIGLIVILPETNVLLYMNKDGTGSLQVLAISILLASVAITGCAILQGIGLYFQPAAWIFSAFVIKWILNEVFVPKWGIFGSAMATVISLLVLCCLVFHTLHRRLPGLSLFKKVDWKAFVIACTGMAAYLSIIKYALSPLIEPSRLGLAIYVPFLVGSGAFIYLFLLLRNRAFTEKQLRALPFSNIVVELGRRAAKK